MIVTMFPEAREQAKAIGVYTFVAVAGGSIGLLVGGVLTEAINWHWIFFVNLPIGVATALAARRLVDDSPGLGVHKGADLPGAALLTGGLMLLVYTILEVEKQGWGSAQTLGLGAVAIALLGAFLLRQSRIANPLMPLRLFHSRNVSGANVIQALLTVGLGMFFLGALYMQRPARLRRARGRARVPAHDPDDGRDVAARRRARQPSLRRRSRRWWRA